MTRYRTSTLEGVGEIIAGPVLGGLHHRDSRAAWIEPAIDSSEGRMVSSTMPCRWRLRLAVECVSSKRTTIWARRGALSRHIHAGRSALASWGFLMDEPTPHSAAKSSVVLAADLDIDGLTGLDHDVVGLLEFLLGRELQQPVETHFRGARKAPQDLA